MTILIAALLASASAEVLAVDARWRQGISGNDKAALEQILGPRYSLITATGTTDRAQWMDKVGIWKTSILEWRAEPRVDVYGEAAIVTGTLHWKVKKDAPDPRTGSADVDQDFVVTDVWIRIGKAWQVVQRHSTIAQPRH
jgi:Domain of unknown function (DUF4440)